MARPFMFAVLCQRAHPLKHSLAESKNSEKIFVSRNIRQQGHSLAEVSLYIINTCALFGIKEERTKMHEMEYFKNVLKQFPFVAVVKLWSQTLYYGRKLHTLITPMALKIVKQAMSTCFVKYLKIYIYIYKQRLKYQEVGLA